MFTASTLGALLLLLCDVSILVRAEDPPPIIPAKPARETVGELIGETGFYQSLRLSKDEPTILKRLSPYQTIEVVRSPHYGKILVLDGVVQLTEVDADAYNEMMAHMPLFQHKSPKNVLIIGGGDGAVLSDVLKHPTVEHVDHVDLDKEVIEVCKEQFSWADGWSDPRVRLHIADGAAFVRDLGEPKYDVIIQDSSDPWTWSEDGRPIELPSSVLYSPEHITNLYRALKPDGILNIQAESLQIPSDLEAAAEWRQVALNVGFETARYGSILISSYPTGQIGFLLCEKMASTASNFEHIRERFQSMRNDGRITTYYHPRLQISSFDLPLWAELAIYSDKDVLKQSCVQEPNYSDIA